MSSYLYFKGIRIFDYPRFAEPFREQIRENAEVIAGGNNVSIEFIRKEDIVAAKIKERGDHPGLVHIISAMEGVSKSFQDSDSYRHPRPYRHVSGQKDYKQSAMRNGQ
jgi:hypothetical protein